MKTKIIALISVMLLSGCFDSEPKKTTRSNQGYETINLKKADEKLFTKLGEGEIEVRYYFAYGCPHCNHFEPSLNQWIKNDANFKKISFQKTPVSLLANWVDLSKLYYVAKQQGFAETINTPLFQALHRENQPLSDWIEAIAKFATPFAQKVDKNLTTDNIIDLMESDEIAEKILADNEKILILDIHATPTLILRVMENGILYHYLIDNNSAKNFGGIIKVLNNLINEILAT